MSTQLDLTPDERVEVQVVLDRFPDWVTIDKLVQIWSGFVHSVETGYSEPSYEYTNDLSTRDMLDEVFAGVSELVQKKLETILGPLDARFFKATRPVDECLARTAVNRREWWYRVPTKMGKALEEDFRDWGLLK